MKVSSVRLFYGVFVTTKSLIIASRAFLKLQSPILAINLIINRKRNDNLQIEVTRSTILNTDNGSVKHVPVEVWEMIKSELIAIEVMRSQREVSGSLACERCLFEPDAIKCDYCSGYSDIIGDFGNGPDSENAEQLLSSQGLQLITEYPIGEPSWSINSLSPVGLAKHYDLSCCGHMREQFDSVRAISKLPPSAFELPSTPKLISKRFKILETIYGIEFGDQKRQVVEGRTIRTNIEEEEVEVGSDEEDDSTSRDYEIPGWQLWTEAYDD